MTKMAKMDTLFMTKMTENQKPLVPFGATHDTCSYIAHMRPPPLHPPEIR